MKTVIIRSSWMEGYGYRLDTQPYVGGALQTKILLEKLPLRKDSLETLCSAILNIGRIKRDWVEDPRYGVPFLSGRDIQKADLSNLSFISKRVVRANPALIVKQGMTLITRSGSIGKMAYCREEMAGKACTEDVLRVVPDPAKIPPGYLYAFLSSKFGVPLVTSGTYGAIIQHLEPEHIAGIDVPRLAPAKEQEIHDLVEEAARLRSEANRIKEEAVNELFEITQLPLSHENVRGGALPCTYVSSSCLESRLDARFHSTMHVKARRLIQISKFGFQTLESLADSIIEPLRFKRIPVDESAHSVGLFGSAGILNVDPKPQYWIQPPRALQTYLISENSLLIPRSGSLNGIIGTPVLAFGDVVGSVVTEDAIRINFTDSKTLGYAFVALNNWIGINQFKSRAYGSAIQYLDVHQIGKALLPSCSTSDFQRIGTLGFNVKQLRDKAIRCERTAISELESLLSKLS